jgi:disulfide bond formation protein DsbB
MRLKLLLSDVVLVCGAVFAFSVIALFTALTAQYVFGLEPCELCLYQRVPYCAAALLSVIALVLTHSADKVRVSAFLIFICALFFFAGGAIAFYHVGVEQHWWKSVLEGCAADLPANLKGADLVKFLQTRKAVRCDEVAWADPLLHLSMASYNVIFSLALAAFSLAGAILITRRANGVLSVRNFEGAANSNER